MTGGEDTQVDVKQDGGKCESIDRVCDQRDCITVNLPEGPLHVSYPATLSADSSAEVDAVLRTVLSRLKRRRGGT